MIVHPINFSLSFNYKARNEKQPKKQQPKELRENLILNFFSAQSNYNISFCASKSNFYCIFPDGTYKKYSDRKKAQEELQLAKTNIAQCLQKKRSITRNYGFVFANEIEKTDENGQTIIDNEKLEAEIKRIKDAQKSKDKPIPIYAIDKNGQYTRFESKYKASKTLDIDIRHIAQVLSKELNKTAEYTFVYPDEIETEIENGKTIVDRKKLSEIVSNAFENKRLVPIYAIDEKGRYQKYSGIRIAARELSLETANISRCLKGESKRVGNYTFVKADEVETELTGGKIIVDERKIKEINDNSLIKESYVPIYAINAFGKCKRFKSTKGAAKELEIDDTAIRHCLQGKYKTIHGFAFIKADKIESEDENGKRLINHDILKSKFEEVNKSAVYAIYPDGSYEKFATTSQAAEKLGLRRTKITDCLSGISTRVSGRTFVKASDIDTYDNGNIYVNKALLKKFAQEVAKPKVKAVYSFDTNGNYKRYESTKQLCETLSLSKTGVIDCLTGKKDFIKGYKIIYAENFESLNEDGETVIDYEKIDGISEEINPRIKKEISKYGKIYALKDVNVRTFDNIFTAARELEIDINVLRHYLKHGLNPEDKTNTIKGYTFTSEKDE